MSGHGEMRLTRREREVLVELCRPGVAERAFNEPASTRDIACALFVTEAAVKQHMLRLYEKFALFDEATNRRMELANQALERGIVTASDVGAVDRGSANAPAATPAEGAVREGHRALARRAFREAFQILAAAKERNELTTADDFAALGEAALWAGDPDTSQTARQTAYQHYLSTGDEHRAAVIAMGLVTNYAIRLKFAAAGGWLGKAHRHLEGKPEGREHALLAAIHGLVEVLGNDLERGYESTKRAMDLGARYGDRDAQALGQVCHACVLQRRRKFREANALFDEAMATATAGELGPLATGIVYCRTVCSCLDVFDYKRALEWTDLAAQAGHTLGEGGFPGDCRAHRATILAARGLSEEALSEARAASTESEVFDLAHTGIASYELGELYLRAGDLELAEQAFARAAELGMVPEPGRSMLAFRQGRPGPAYAALARAVEEVGQDPLRRARLRPAQVDLALSLGRLDYAKVAQRDLEDTARDFESKTIDALSTHARGKIALSEARVGEAVADLTASARLFAAMEMPLQAARARFDLGRALDANGARDAALLELQAASASFRKLGAAADADAVEHFLT
jgi:tetratricopeptide (TPR) repeat protein